MRREIQLSVLRALNALCVAVDDVAYRPFVVKLTEPLPRWWSCELARLSMALDDRWGVGWWESDKAAAAPSGLCEACGRRSAWLTIGGIDPDDPSDDEPDPDDYLATHRIHTCAWCRPKFPPPPRTGEDARQALAKARNRSVSWSWSSN